jgi:hypothetical protein
MREVFTSIIKIPNSKLPRTPKSQPEIAMGITANDSDDGPPNGNRIMKTTA